MPETGLGVLLRKLREGRKLSFRELAQLSGVDHAYIYRLEAGDKEAPSIDTLLKLSKALKADKREADILRYLAEHSETSPDLVNLAVEDTTITFDVFKATAGMAFRGSARPDYTKLVERVRRILAEEDEDG